MDVADENRIRRMLFAGTALLALSSGVAFAQQTQISTPTQPLSQSLKDVAHQTSENILFTPDAVDGLRARPLNGRMNAQEAVQTLIAGTDLEAISDGSGGLIVQRKGASAASRPTRPKQLGDAGRAPPSGSAQVEEIVVTAQKREERLKDVPVPVTVITAQTLADNGLVRLRDYYSMIPGFSLTPSYQGNQYLTIRGIATGGTQDPTVGVMIDDLPFTSSLAGGNGLPDLDPSDFTSVEVLRGPQGTLYGANSMGGLIKFVAKDPSFDAFSGHVQAGTSFVYNAPEPGFNLRGSANIPLGDNLAMRLSAFDRLDPGFIDNVLTSTRGVDEAHAGGGRMSILWQAAEDLSLKVSVLYQDVTTDGQQVIIKAPGLGDLQQSLVSGAGQSNRQTQSYNATFKYDLGSIEVTSLTGYGVNRYHDTFDTGFFGDGVLLNEDGAIQYDYFTDRKFTEELRVSSSIDHALDWIVGAFYTHEQNPNYEVEYARNVETGFIAGADGTFALSSEYEEYAGFADATYYISDQFDVQVGGRYSNIRVAQGPETDGGPFAKSYESGDPTVTPGGSSTAHRLTFLFTSRYRLSSDVTVYGRIASGYRPGGANQGCVAERIPCSYNPDKIIDYDIGAKGYFLDHKLFIDASLYYLDWQDIQLKLDTPLAFGYQGNGGNAKSAGVELSVEFKPVDDLSLSGWVDYDDARITQPPLNGGLYVVAGERLAYSSPWSGNFSAEKDFRLPNGWTGFAGVVASFVGDRLGIFTGTAGHPAPRQDFPAYTRTDLRAGVRGDSWVASLYVNNVADVRGLIGGGPGYYPPNAFAVIQPRTVGLTLTEDF